MELIINYLKMKGFRHHVKQVEYTFDDKFTNIIGDNGKGKSTIGEGIIWTFFGANIMGNERADSVLVNKNTKVTECEVGFTVDGEKHIIWRRRKGSSTDIVLDEKKAKNIDLLNILVDKQIFLTIFNPVYFPNLTPKETQKLLMNVIPDVKKDEVFKQLDENSKEFLNDKGFHNIDVYIEGLREEMKETDKDITKHDGVIETLTQRNITTSVPKKIDFDDSEILEVEKRLEELNNQKPPHDIVALQKQKLDIQSKILELENKNKPQLKNVETIKEKIEILEQRKRTVPIQVPNYIDIENIQANLNALAPKHKSLQKKLSNKNSIIYCPECNSEIDLNKKEKELIKIEMKELVSEGKKLKNELEKANAANEQMKAEYEKICKEHIDECNRGIVKLQAELKKAEEYNKNEVEIFEEKIKDEIRILNNKIADLMIEEKEMENENFITSLNNKKGTLRTELTELRLEKTKADQHNSSITATLEQIKKDKETVAKSKNEIEKLKDVKNTFKKLLQAANNFKATKLDMQAETINKYFNRVSLKLYDLVKSTGEIKPTFKLMFDNKEFQVLSTSEKIKAGLEISNLFINILDFQFPIFVDNAESITAYDKPDTQIIEASVLKGQELKVFNSNSMSIKKNEEVA